MKVDPSLHYFVDTNILVYAYDRSAGDKHRLAVQLIKDCWENENGCLSIQVLHEFHVTVTQKIAAALDRQMVRQIIVDLAQWRVQIPEVSDLLQAIDLQEHYQLSFWDAMVVQSAARLGCTQLLSEDMNHSQWYGDVQVINPFEEAN